MLKINYKTNNQGLTLVEVMVALVILSVGLLGLAGLQIAGLRGVTGSNNRVQATMVANDLAERMGANFNSANNYIGNLQANACPAAGADCFTGNCATNTMAAYDLEQICQTMATQLPPGSTMTVACPGACIMGSTFTITVNWNEVGDSNVAVAQARNVALTVIR